MSIQVLYERFCFELNDIHEHLPILRDFVEKTNAQQVIELGTGFGRSTTALLMGLEKTGGRLWSCDVETPDASRYPDIWLHPQLDKEIADDLDVVDKVSRCDVLFIDSAHNYDQTLAELRAYVPKVRSGGVLAMHDTVSWMGHVDRAIRDYFGNASTREEWHTNCNGLYVRYL